MDAVSRTRVGLVQPFQRRDRRRIQRRSVDREMRTVAGAVPALLEGIPVQMAANMRAGGGDAVKPALSSRKAATLRRPSRMMAPLPGFIVDGFQFAGRDILGEILHRRHVLGDEVLGCRNGHAGGIVKSSHGHASPLMRREIRRLPATPWVRPWPELPVCTKTCSLPGLRPLKAA